ncbi:hypothetical protein MGN70_012825 [Eutypa lata]|uniref:Uncharacterized protein n=1 Tax=Eutypa lata (strain UCR-EL1) TaxID=1287681 RepID=M7SGZ0_EUTLA|nr:hypothetical protein UCREL1_7473 [Eutypa lata UCREL1]KAI1245931.1 hypothetical protein MGN70_012825 [Eutypa lata]
MAPATLGLLFLSTIASALPASGGSSQALSVPHRRCGPVSEFYGQTADDWQSYGTDQWLSDWFSNNSDEISSNSNGFAGAFGEWAIGNPDWSCRDDGSASSCDLDLCDNNVLNNRGDDIRSAYYVLEGINRLHSYFAGISQAFETSAIATSLSKESWSLTFYEAKDDSSAINTLKEVLTLTTTVIAVGAAFAGLGPAAPAAFAGAIAAAAGGASTAAQIQINAAQDDTFEKDADLGAILSKVVVGSMKSFTSANNQLVAGQNYENSGDIKTYLSGGAFVNFGGVDKNAVIDQMNAFLLGNAVNQLWGQQKIFIMGGGQCGDDQGIGSGPQDYSVCRDGKAWYLYYWHEGNGDFLSEKQWGYVTVPPGADQLGQGDFAGVTVADVINSSLDSYNVAEYAYDADKAAERVQDALGGGWQNPGAQGPSWEGTFTVPVCDVSDAVNQDWYMKEYILEDHDENARPVWCGPICSNDWDKTKRFIEAAGMGGFKSPKHICTDNGVDIYY